MRRESLLTIEPPARVETTAELYDIAYGQAETAAQRYGALTAIAIGESHEPVRSVFKKLEQAALHRARDVSLACVAILDKQPDGTHLKWPPTDLVPGDELSEIANSSLTTPYLAWALAVRHRERGFVFWTYVAAHAEGDDVRTAAETMARDALHDANELRRERRLAWRSERHLPSDDKSPDGASDIPLAALLESLLFKDILAWSQGLPTVERGHLIALAGDDLAGAHSTAMQMGSAMMDATLEARRRAVHRAEQLSSIYLDEADHATDPEQLDLAQKLAAQAITRLADLRTIAAASAE